ncbi:MAG TPA: hypothetical protein VE964_19290 [Myxococcales bacterium]|nr:hypothetical protein [Myxococcales bacterium]
MRSGWRLAALGSRARMGPALVVSLGILAGCRTLPFPQPQLTGEYGLVLGKWTRSVTLYSGLETRGFCRAVFLSPEFVDAQAKKISEMRAELPDEAQRTRERLRAQAATPTVFAIFYTPDKQSNDWNEKDSVWRIALNQGLGQVEPQKIERYERPFNAEIRSLYPYLDDYSVAYLIHFPGQSAPAGFTATELQMVVAGALGKMDFKWNLLHPEKDKQQ